MYFVKLEYILILLVLTRQPVWTKKHRGDVKRNWQANSLAVFQDGVSLTTAETVEGNRVYHLLHLSFPSSTIFTISITSSSSCFFYGKQYASREIKLIGKNQFLREVLRQCYGRCLSNQYSLVVDEARSTFGIHAAKRLRYFSDDSARCLSLDINDV